MKTETSLTFKHLVIGMGEVGKALQKILECDGFDVGDECDEFYDVIHICFPYGEGFEDSVRDYQVVFDTKYTVIHSTVPVGVSRSLGAIHSPVRGVHPHLEPSIRTFVKYFSGEGASLVAKDFTKQGMFCTVIEKQETTELMKLVDTTAYGLNILIEKEIHRLCRGLDVPFEDVYTDANNTYNTGYSLMGMPQFVKYNIEHRDGPIGGHCILPNVELFDSWMCDIVKEKNATL